MGPDSARNATTTHPIARPRFLSCGSVGSVLLLVCAFLTACGPTTYMRATGVYSGAVKAGTAAFGAGFEAALQQCHRRAQLDRARHLIEGAVDKDVDWAAHCDEIEKSIEVHRKTVGQVAQYAAALQTLADGAKYEGEGTRDAAAAAAAIAGTLKDKDSPEAKYAGAIAGPLSLLATFVLSQYATVQIKKAIADSSPGITALLRAMETYVAASELQLFVYEDEVGQFLKLAEKRIRKPPVAPKASLAAPSWWAPAMPLGTSAESEALRRVPPLEAIQFVREAELLTTEIESSRATHRALKAIVTALLVAQARLERAGERDKEELKAIINSLVEVGQAAGAVVAATGSGGS